MNASTGSFDELLQNLNDARLADEDIHRRDASLEERAASHDVLVHIRSKVARFRTDNGLESTDTTGLRDSRTRRGVHLD